MVQAQLNCNEATEEMAKAACEFWAYEDAIPDILERMTPCVQREVVDSYGVNFSSLKQVYEDMHKRACEELDYDDEE